jgi:hypothetical protein
VKTKKAPNIASVEARIKLLNLPRLYSIVQEDIIEGRDGNNWIVQR